MTNFILAAARAAAIGLALFAAACAGKAPIATLNTAAGLNTIYSVEASYGAALAAENTYRNLPLCKTGTAPSVTNICAKRSVIVKLQAADAKTFEAVKAARDFVKTYPTLDATNVLNAAQAAISDLQSIINAGN